MNCHTTTSRPRSGAWVALTSLLAFLVALSGCGEGSPTTENAAGSLRLRFPDQAERILSEGRFHAGADGFTLGERAALDVVLPAEGSEPVRVRFPGGADLHVRELGVQGAAIPLDGAVAYARDGGTSLWTSSPAGVEEWLHLDAGEAYAHVVVGTWQIDGGTPRQTDEGVVHVFDANGRALVRVTAPIAYTATGRELRPVLAVRDDRIELSVDANGEAVLVDPAWAPAGNLSVQREWHTATRLANGKVLVAGGWDLDPGPLSSVELYDPGTNVWSVGASMAQLRTGHTATLLGISVAAMKSRLHRARLTLAARLTTEVPRATRQP